MCSTVEVWEIHMHVHILMLNDGQAGDVDKCLELGSLLLRVVTFLWS